jgi:hypothetical protein
MKMGLKFTALLIVLFAVVSCKKAKIIDSCENNSAEISPSGYNKDSAIIFLPTAFSPNGDDLNDLFRPLISGIDVTSFKVCRRNKVIFTADDENTKWDGTDQDDKKCIDGVYTYVIKGNNTTDGNFEIIGEISLISEGDLCIPCWFEDQIDPTAGFINPTGESCDGH